MGTAARELGSKSPIQGVSSNGNRMPSMREARRNKRRNAMKPYQTTRTKWNRAQWKAHYESQREPAHKRGYDHRWRKVREAQLGGQPECTYCLRPATDVDHVIPHRGDPKLFHDPDNLQSLCHECHSMKTAAGE